MRAALDELLNEGVKNRIHRYEENWDRLRSGLLKLGFKLLLESSQESKVLLTIIEPDDPNFSFTGLHDRLFEEGFTIYPGKVYNENTFRLSILGDLYLEDIDDFLVNLNASLEYINVSINPMHYS